MKEGVNVSHINWEQEVETRKEELMTDLFELLKINSVRDLEHKTKELPVGPGPAKALETFLSFGARDGFKIKNIDNLAGHVEYGSGNETLGVLGHVDVVPTGDGWKTNPFEPVIKEGKLYARGASDDKGPMLAAYYGLKIIKELDLPVSKKVRFIIGTDEENDWLCMDKYQEVEKMPDFGFSPDAEFPIINGEKGIATLDVRMPFITQKEGDIQLDSFKSGLATNMVPGDAHVLMSLINIDSDAVSKAFETFIKEHKLSGSTEIDSEHMRIKLVGKSAHAQNPSAGVNAATYLAHFLSQFKLDAQGEQFIDIIDSFLHLDHKGERLGIYIEDEVMGPLTASPNLFTYMPDGEQQVSVNVRYPKGTDSHHMVEQVSERLSDVIVVARPGGETPHYVPADDPLVETLLRTYEEHTGVKGSEKTIGGGTYGRLFERGVAYGAMFPGREDTMHQANEYMHVDDIFKSAAIYGDAIYQLIK